MKIIYGPWKKHTPGKQPVSNDTSVEIEMRSGVTIGPITARLARWDEAGDSTCKRYRTVEYIRDLEHERSEAVLGKCAQT